MLGFISAIMHKITKSGYNKQKKEQKKAQDKIKKAEKEEERNKREEELLNRATASEDSPSTSEKSNNITQKDIETARKKLNKVGVLWTNLLSKVTGAVEAIPVTVVAVQIICIILVVAIIAVIIFSVVSMIANSLIDTVALEGAAFDWNNAYTNGFYLEEDIDEDGYRHIRITLPGGGSDDPDGVNGSGGGTSSSPRTMDMIDFWCSLTDETIWTTAEHLTTGYNYRVRIMNNLRMIRMAYRMCYPDGSANLGDRVSAMTPELILGMMCSEKGYGWMGAEYSYDGWTATKWYVAKSGKLETVSSSADLKVYNVDNCGYAGSFDNYGWRDGPFSFSVYTPGMPEYSNVSFTANALNKILSSPIYAELFAKLTGLVPSGHGSFSFQEYYASNYGWAADLLTSDYSQGGTLSMYTTSSNNPFISSSEDCAQRNLFLSMFVTVCTFGEWYTPSSDSGDFITGGGYFTRNVYNDAYNEFVEKFGEPTASFKADVAAALFYPNKHHLPGWDSYYDKYKTFSEYDVDDYRRGQLWLAAAALYEADGAWSNIRHASYVDLEAMQKDYDSMRLALIPDVGGMHGSTAGTWFYYPAQKDQYKYYKPSYDEFKSSIASKTYGSAAYEPLTLHANGTDTNLGTSLWDWLVNNSDCYKSGKDSLLKPMVHSIGYGNNSHALAFEGMDAILQGGEVATRCTYVILGVMAGGVFDASKWAISEDNPTITVEMAEDAFLLGGRYRPITSDGEFSDSEIGASVFPVPEWGNSPVKMSTATGWYEYADFPKSYPNGWKPHGGMDVICDNSTCAYDYYTTEQMLKKNLWSGSNAMAADCKRVLGDDMAGMCPVYAIADGWVETVTWGYDEGDIDKYVTGGNVITILHRLKTSDGYANVYINYMHLSLASRCWFDPSNQAGLSNTVSIQTVSSIHASGNYIPIKAGQIIGYMSSTGCSSGRHLHWGNNNMKGEDGRCAGNNGSLMCLILLGTLKGELSYNGSYYYPFSQPWWLSLESSATAMEKWGNPRYDMLDTITKLMEGG